MFFRRPLPERHFGSPASFSHAHPFVDEIGLSPQPAAKPTQIKLQHIP
jgi:hypothetical protein